VLQQYFEQGQRALTEGRYAEAAAAFEKLRELEPGIAEVHAALGVSYFQQGKFEQAAPPLRRALDLKPGLSNAEALLAMSLAELGRYEQALPRLKKAFEQSRDPALRRSAGLRLQRAYTGLGRDGDAVETALKLVRLYPEDPEVLYHASRVYANAAYLTTRKLEQAAPDSVWMHQAAGDAYESQGRHDLAIAEYRKVLTLDPGRPGIHFRLGRTLLAQPSRSEAEALKEFERELEIDPTNANAAYEAAEIHRKLREFQKARELFEQAATHYPDFEQAHLGLSRVLLDLNRPQDALPHLRKALSLNPESEVAYYRLWQAQRALGDEQQARQALAEFRRLREENSRRRKSRELLSARDVTEQQVDPAEAP